MATTQSEPDEGTVITITFPLRQPEPTALQLHNDL
jgi:signal transduction histidine kinase